MKKGLEAKHLASLCPSMIENNHHQPETSKKMLSLRTENISQSDLGSQSNATEPSLPMPGTAVKHLHFPYEECGKAYRTAGLRNLHMSISHSSKRDHLSRIVRLDTHSTVFAQDYSYSVAGTSASKTISLTTWPHTLPPQEVGEKTI
ncbi:unnamed protein product [Coregonus sp. 'balchen']|nr:unnamed protein product [Coregonus sp. 'balchen']